jgi:hypothetical protein
MNMEAFNLQSVAEIPPGELSTHTHHYNTTEPYTLNISTHYFFCALHLKSQAHMGLNSGAELVSEILCAKELQFLLSLL